MKNIKLTLFLLIFTAMHMALCATATHNIADLKERMAYEHNIETIDRNVLEVKYNKEIDQLFDYELLTNEQRNMLFYIKQDCLSVLLALVAEAEYDLMKAEQLDVIKLTAKCFAQWGESVAAVAMQEQLEHSYAKSSAELIACARRDGYNRALKLALSKKKKCLRYIIDGTLEQAVQKALEDEINGLTQ